MRVVLCLLALVALAAVVAPVSAYVLPGTRPQEYARGERVDLKVSQLDRCEKRWRVVFLKIYDQMTFCATLSWDVRDHLIYPVFLSTQHEDNDVLFFSRYFGPFKISFCPAPPPPPPLSVFVRKCRLNTTSFRFAAPRSSNRLRKTSVKL